MDTSPLFPIRADLAGTPVGLKIKWAKRHGDQLLGELERFRERQPYEITTDFRDWQGRPYRVERAENVEAPPADLALLFGDFIQNLRAALDYLIGEMRPDGPSQDSAFPICRNETGKNGFDKLSPAKLAGIPDNAKKIVETMQPYDRPDDSRDLRRLANRPLAELQTLWNIEKHRTILLASAAVGLYYVGHNRPSKEPSGIGQRGGPPHDYAEWWLPLDEGDQTFDPHFRVEVSLAKPRGFADDWPERLERRPLDGVVSHLYRTVAHMVVPQFREFIEPRW